MNKTKAQSFDFFKSKNPLLRVLGLLVPLIEGEINLSQNMQVAKADLSPQDASLVQALSFGTSRVYHRLDIVKNKLLKKPLAKKDADINALLLLAMFQLTEKSSPDYAIVDKCVSASADLQKSWAKGFINGVLRNFIRKYRNDLATGAYDKIAQNQIELDILEFSHPNWIIEKLKKTYAEKYKEILNANNQQAPMVLRTNAKKISRDLYLKQLLDAKIEAEKGDLPNAIYLKSPLNVDKLPNFSQGFVSLQDEAAQLLPHLISLDKNAKILDACAAPGGKTTAMLEAENSLEITALDKDATRMQKIIENINRLDLNKNTKTLAADFLNLPEQIKNTKYDRILLDVPCSASGIIRRHPDIKLMRKKADLPKFVTQELAMLEVAKSLLKKDGFLIYSTCSVFYEENSQLIEKFLKQNPNLEIKLDIEYLKKRLALDDFFAKAEITKYGIQLLPKLGANDGFFYASIGFKNFD